MEIKNTRYSILDSENDEGFDTTVYVQYKYVYADLNSILSHEQLSEDSIHVEVTTTHKVIVLYFIPSVFDKSVDKLQIYRATSTDNFTWTEYYYVGEVKPESEGIFVDKNNKKGKVLKIPTDIEKTYESAVRWTQPYKPSHIKAESFVEYRSGDGSQITGLESLYGNLVIFKETSMHRAAVQAQDPPISRTDEVSPSIGCIAPNALVNVNNVLYFLSWQGVMRYDNNRFDNIDALFNEELQFILNSHKEGGSGIIRDASMTYNPYYNEIYLNIPPLPSEDRYYDYGTTDMYGTVFNYQGRDYNSIERTILGHIYVISLNKQYVTKFGYPSTVLDPDTTGKWITENAGSRDRIRKYYINSFGEMRSADILPHRYNSNTNGLANPAYLNGGYSWSGIYIETPYMSLKPKIELKYTGNVVTDAYLQEQADWKDTLVTDMDESLEACRLTTTVYPSDQIFPVTTWLPVKSYFKSKFFTGDTETMLKRVRKSNFNLYSKGEIEIKAITIEHDSADDHIENISKNLLFSEETFLFNPTVPTYQRDSSPHFLTGTGTNILNIVTSSPYDDEINQWEDHYGKPIRFSFEITSKLRTEINSIGMQWRPIHSYLS